MVITSQFPDFESKSEMIKSGEQGNKKQNKMDKNNMMV